MNTERSDLFFKTNAEDFHFTMRSDLKFNTSSIVDTINEDFSADGLDFNSFKSRNHGMGLSFGATYQILPKIVLSASILDLGRITWKDNVQNYETKAAASS